MSTQMIIAMLSGKNGNDAFMLGNYIYKIRCSSKPIIFDTCPVAFVVHNQVYSYGTHKQIGSKNGDYIKDCDGKIFFKIGRNEQYVLYCEPEIPSIPNVRIGAYVEQVTNNQWSDNDFFNLLQI